MRVDLIKSYQLTHYDQVKIGLEFYLKWGCFILKKT